MRKLIILTVCLSILTVLFTHLSPLAYAEDTTAIMYDGNAQSFLLLNEDETKVLSLSKNEDNNADYQWEILVDEENGTWEELEGQSVSVIEVVYQTLKDIAGEDDTVQLRCRMTVNEEVSYSSVLTVELFEHVFVEQKFGEESKEDREERISEEDEIALIDDELPEEEEAEELVWLSYESYLENQSAYLSWYYPSFYVGLTAVFNVDYYLLKDFEISSTPEDEMYDYWDEEVDYFFGLTSESDSEEEEEDEIVVTAEEVKGLEVVITDYYFNEDQGMLWFKVEAAEGYEAPELLVENPYVLQAWLEDDPPALLLLPTEGIFTDEVIHTQKDLYDASRVIEVPTENLPYVMDVIYQYESEFGTSWYDVGDLTSYVQVDGLNANYHYIPETDVILVQAEVTAAYKRLLSAESSWEFTDLYESIPAEILEMMTDYHIEKVNAHYEELVRLENIVIESNVQIGEEVVDVAVKGKIPETAELILELVVNEKLIEEGFTIENFEDVILALDVKIMNEGAEWQPEENQIVELTIDMATLGYEDGSIVQLQHKHGETITTFDIFVVMDGKLTIYTGGFSIYTVQRIGERTTDNNAVVAPNRGSFSLEVGSPSKIYYFNVPNAGNGRKMVGTWDVEDPTGAIHYTVHTSNATMSNEGILAQWIEITPLKATSTPVRLTYNYAEVSVDQYKQTTVRSRGQEYFDLTITKPTVSAGQRELYIKDEINTDGIISAALIDSSGAELSLEGAAFKWVRDDGLYIIPPAYENNYRSVNVARDHGGLVEARKGADGKHKPVKYTVYVTLADGTELDASYTVYYQSEIINSSFETPNATNSNYTYLYNGISDLYWKTTAPGFDNTKKNGLINDDYVHLTKDIEVGDVTGGNDGNTGFGVTSAAHGVQFAELNAERVGALYQDIISAPGEEIKWEFSHAPRPKQSWSNSPVYNKMFIVIGATEKAQALNNDQLNKLVQAAKAQATTEGVIGNYSWTSPVEVTYEGGDYVVWYHDADQDPGNAGNKWVRLEGAYEVPENQYRTRLFFVSDPDYNQSIVNAGNLIDASSAGQYKTYLIEYYEESFDVVEGTTVKTTKYIGSATETGRALIYSSVELLNYQGFLKENDFLHMVLINGDDYPYDIRKTVNDGSGGQRAYLYINNYTGDAVKPDIHVGEGFDVNNNNYDDYDIVMQVFLRDTVISVQKELMLPNTMTEEQKLTLMDSVNANGGYISFFELRDMDPDHDYASIGHSKITQRDPEGNFKGFISLGENPPVGHSYLVEELTEYDGDPNYPNYDLENQLVGLQLSNVRITVVRYKDGEGVQNDNLVPADYWTTDIEAGYPLVSDTFTLTGDEPLNGSQKNIRLADVTITNYYKEKMTTFKYVAIGKGKVSLHGHDEYVDIPTEELEFYSGKSDGVEISAGKGATFVGWFKDPACEEKDRITEVDGKVDDDGYFRPNPNVITTEEVTFYAKFVTSSIVINRTVADPNEILVYHVQGKAGTGSAGVDMYVSIQCDDEGNGSVEISELAKGEYTVTEVSDWAWRYPELATQTKTLGEEDVEITFDFSAVSINHKWLNGVSEIFKNVWGKLTPGVTDDAEE